MLYQVQLRVSLNAQIFHAPEINRAGSAVSAINGIALLKQQLREVGAVLACDPCDDGFQIDLLGNFLCYEIVRETLQWPLQRSG